MGHNPGKKALAAAERERAREIAREQGPRRAAARNLIALWNLHLASGWRSMFYPTVGTALFAGAPWLHVVCPACQIVGEVDLCTVDIHPGASVATVVRRLSCQRCCPHPPFAKPTGLTRRSWYSVNRAQEPWKRRRFDPLDLPENEREGWGARTARRR